MPSVIPLPAVVEPRDGSFELSSRSTISFPAGAEATAKRIQDDLAACGLRLRLDQGGSRGIQLVLDPSRSPLGPEAYRLMVTPQTAQITASAEAGLYWGFQTLRQMMPVEIYSLAPVRGVRFLCPCCAVDDAPRFPWRGCMVDVARHFRSVEWLKGFIDWLAIHKLNVFHWHLTEDQGWRIEIKKYPKLTEVGAWRKETLIGQPYGPRETWRFDGIPHGGFYTQEQVKEVVAYAAARHITVVPEIEMPGHAQAAIAAYPELGNTGEKLDVLTWWGVNENVFNVKEETFQFLFNVLDEVCDLFPSKWIHIGGDEVPKVQWEKSSHAQQVMKENNLKDTHELQSWFIRRIDKHLDAKGRRLVGWDEILEGGLAEGATVMSWRGTSGGIAAAKAGHDVVMSPTSHMYLDYYQSRNTQAEPLAIGGYVPLRQVYSFEPVPESLTFDEAKHILGPQGNLWTEYIRDDRKLEYMAWPRMCAVAEVGWTAAEAKDLAAFTKRLDHHLGRLDMREVNYRPLEDEESGRLGGWKEGEVSDAFSVKTWDISKGLLGPGPGRIVFQYTSGGHRLDIEWVELLLNGQVVQRIDQYGITGAFNRDNAYAVNIPVLRPGDKLELRANVRGDGGGDTNGDILHYRPNR